jgi:hypothetical protein
MVVEAAPAEAGTAAAKPIDSVAMQSDLMAAMTRVRDVMIGSIGVKSPTGVPFGLVQQFRRRGNAYFAMSAFRLMATDLRTLPNVGEVPLASLAGFVQALGKLDYDLIAFRAEMTHSG